ncbi:alpha/beta hydrolase [Actinomadura violacea]|uniref:Alpha/beta hydrolase n=1 Tax=Actinomadura violacea TaxID=2819934 RepID=A0ABS3RNR1_9ACTN|nr:alpha/beta hydrolase-fold protein [Actinomadura violacea]MBO2458400.1 alpha/beta hydrolase [Actinomadura violacea]
MTITWAAERMELPGAVRYTVVTGTEPGDQWHVTVAPPPPNLRKAAGPGPFPALYLLDGLLTFATAAQIAHTTFAYSLGQLRPIVVVGISPATDDLRRLSAQRARDMTPTSTDSGYLHVKTTYGMGGAAAMVDLIRDVIAPHLESAHPLDPADRGLGGFSLGGLLTCWALLRRPEGFRRFLAVSPSLWWDDHLLLDPGRTPVAARDAGDVYLAVGELEDGPHRSWPIMPDELCRELADLDMVADLAAFTGRLDGDRDLAVRSEVIPGEQHATVWPAAVTRGLVHLYRTDRDGGDPRERGS